MLDQIVEKFIITAGVIIIDGGKILLVKRPLDTKAFPGAWSFPAGKIEPGETLVECAMRECIEEAKVAAIELVPHSFHEHAGKNARTISHLFLAKTNDTVVESDQIRWFSKEELGSVEVAFNYKSFIGSIL